MHSEGEELRVPQTFFLSLSLFIFFFFLKEGGVGEMGAQRVDQTGRKGLSFGLVSEKGIFSLPHLSVAAQ